MLTGSDDAEFDPRLILIARLVDRKEVYDSVFPSAQGIYISDRLREGTEGM